MQPDFEEACMHLTPDIRPRRVLAACVLLLLAACSREAETVSESRYVEPDRLYETLDANVHAQPGFEKIVDIDHSRLAAAAGSSMPPAHVLIWSDPELDAAVLQHNPLAALDLPLRALAFEDQATGKAAVISNSWDYVANRHSLPDDEALRSRYEGAIGKALAGIPAGSIARFESDSMKEPGIVTFESRHDFAETERRIQQAIDAQSDTVNFGRVDFAARSQGHGVSLQPMVLLLFGGPGPGGKAMESAPTLGLDAFCQKLLIWQDTDGTVRVSLNDLLTLAHRQQVPASMPLRVVNRRLQGTFSEALEN
jgi:uncharacterized protein (DUF302 family)